MEKSNVLAMEKNLATMRYGLFQDRHFVTALARLTANRFKDPRTTLHVMKLSKTMNKEMQDAQEMFLKMLKDYAELDELGNIKPESEERPGTFKVREDKIEEWKEAFPKFNAIEVCLNRKKLKLEDLEGYELSAQEMDVLSGLIELPEE